MKLASELGRYLLADQPAVADDKSVLRARIESKKVKTLQRTGFCLTWYYHMFGKSYHMYSYSSFYSSPSVNIKRETIVGKGSDVGALNVYVYTPSRNKTNLVWRFGENGGDIWNAAQVSLPIYSGDFSLVFEGE